MVLVLFNRKFFEGLSEFDEKTILKIAAILDTNAFEIRPTNKASKIRAIYPQASMFSHDCVPNTRHIFTENYDLLMIATGKISLCHFHILLTCFDRLVDIPKGSVINVTYTQALKNTLERQEHLKQSKCFDCICVRCSDPTELQTYFGAVNCSRCKIGKVTSTNPMDNALDWQCDACHHRTSTKQIRYTHTTLQNEIANLNRNDPMEFEHFLVKYSDILHPLNSHVVQVKYALIQLYGKVRGFTLNGK